MEQSAEQLIYVRVEPQHISLLNWIMEGYEYLALVTTINGKAGIIKLQPTPYTYGDVIEILQNLPFEAEILQELPAL